MMTSGLIYYQLNTFSRCVDKDVIKVEKFNLLTPLSSPIVVSVAILMVDEYSKKFQKFISDYEQLIKFQKV